MSIEISTVGAMVGYAEATGTGLARPTTGYSIMPNIKTAPEVGLSVSTLDASDFTDKIKSYIPGQQDPGGDLSFTANHTEEFITAWDAIVGKHVWFEYYFPNATKAFFFRAMPMSLGTDSVENDSVHTITGHVVVEEVPETAWITAVAPTA